MAPQMASGGFLIAITVAVAVAMAPAAAVDYMVGGDDAGWNLGVDYAAWAKGKDFRVGDTLTFIYAQGDHNVLEVNDLDFHHCGSSNASTVPLITGHDKITLDATGKRWFICDIGDHCPKGMKLVITISDVQAAPALAPVPDKPDSSSTCGIVAIKSCLWIVVVAAACTMIVS